MEKILCFIINDEKIYLEKTLEEFNGIPIFFICKGNKGKNYLALCYDVDNLFYVVIETTKDDLYYMLIGNTSIRDIFLKQSFYYLIKTGLAVGHDSVEKHNISDLDQSILPLEDVFYAIHNKDVKNYVSRF